MRAIRSNQLLTRSFTHSFIRRWACYIECFVNVEYVQHGRAPVRASA